MYKVLIVDDEYYFRQALKVSLPWTELELQVVGEAKNGEDALEQMSILHPDIIMVDINMPIMDGLTFIAEARSAGYNAKFILLTGHSEFAYAKHAIQLGVFNYVLKPIDTEEIQHSLNEIKDVINQERHARQELIGYVEVTRSALKVSLYSMDKRSSFLKSMRTGNASEVEAWLSEFFSHARATQASLDMLLVAGFEIYSTCMEFLEEVAPNIHDIIHAQAEPDLQGLIERMDSLSEFEDWIRSLIRNMMEHVHNKKSSRSGMIVEEVQRFIQTHYRNEELRIEDIARGVHMNYTHLCYVFKKETATTINDYLTQVRMQKAKALFDQGCIIVQDVANRVGYSDANYFGKCFKKYAGITPSKYIANIGKG